jgi:putative lipoic acid-binding regulatory protein
MEIGTFVALIAYATITKNQWYESSKAASAATIAANAAQSQLTEMDESNRINREALETVQRAFVNFTTPETILIPSAKGRFYQVDISMENTGNTQAHALKDRVSWIHLPIHCSMINEPWPYQPY